MPAVWATALAAAGAYVRRLLLLHAPGTHQLLAALYSALPRGTTTVLTTIFSGLVATLAVLLLRPRVLRAGVKNVVPFLAVAGSTALAVLVPLAIGLAITSLGLKSTSWWTGDNGIIPGFCTWRDSVYHNAHFNARSSGNSRDDMHAIC